MSLNIFGSKATPSDENTLTSKKKPTNIRVGTNTSVGLFLIYIISSQQFEGKGKDAAGPAEILKNQNNSFII